MFSGPMSSKIFIDFVNSISEKHGKPIAFILDDASFHKLKEVKECTEELRRKNITLKFLPPYSPELNRMEKFWHTVKHNWMEVKCRIFAELHADLCSIFDDFGVRFKFAFNA